MIRRFKIRSFVAEFTLDEDNPSGEIYYHSDAFGSDFVRSFFGLCSVFLRNIPFKHPLKNVKQPFKKWRYPDAGIAIESGETDPRYLEKLLMRRRKFISQVINFSGNPEISQQRSFREVRLKISKELSRTVLKICLILHFSSSLQNSQGWYDFSDTQESMAIVPSK